MSEIVFRPPDDDCYYPADTDGECWGYERFQIFPADQQMVPLAEVLALVEERRAERIAKREQYTPHMPDDLTPSQAEYHFIVRKAATEDIDEAEEILRRLREEFEVEGD